MSKKISVFELYDKLSKGNNEDYGTGIVGEAMIIKGYKLMSIRDLEALRLIINKIINQKRQNGNTTTNNNSLATDKKNK